MLVKVEALRVCATAAEACLVGGALARLWDALSATFMLPAAAAVAFRRLPALPASAIPAIADGPAKTLTLVKSGAGAQEAAKASGVFWKNEREFLRQARSWTLPHIDEVQAELLAADKACKTSGSPDQLIAERMALTIAGRARRLGL